MKTSELKDTALDWSVAKAQKMQTHIGHSGLLYIIRNELPTHYKPSDNWSQGGPIIEREEIATKFWKSEGAWIADVKGGFFEQYGPTPLIAAMRCFVASKLGDEVEIPEELI